MKIKSQLLTLLVLCFLFVLGVSSAHAQIESHNCKFEDLHFLPGKSYLLSSSTSEQEVVLVVPEKSIQDIIIPVEFDEKLRKKIKGQELAIQSFGPGIRFSISSDAKPKQINKIKAYCIVRSNA